MKVDKIKLLRVTTIPLSLKVLLAGQLAHVSKKGFEVLAVSSDGPEVVDGRIGGVEHQVVEMTRKITPIRDTVALLKLCSLILRSKPFIVHTHTPKAGLLGMVAAWICRVPVRMHTVAGLPLIEKTGLLRKILIYVEKITYSCATTVYPNSHGLKQFILSQIGPNFPLKVIGNGSTNGIDTNFFARHAELEERALLIRREHGIQESAIVFSFVGRVVNDKGIHELITAFKKCRRENAAPRYVLLVVGSLEQDLDPLRPDDLTFLGSDNDVILAGYQSDVRPWIMASDIFVFPSYREGFPNVVMQASCLEVPCIVTDINGCNEIIDHNQTGLVVAPKDSENLFEAMRKLSLDPGLRRQLAVGARENITSHFDQKFVWAELEKEYREQIAAAEARIWRIYPALIKPLLDRFVSFILLLVTSPLVILCMAILALTNGGKVWFLQTRPGKGGKLFKVIKFRTMRDRYNHLGEPLPDKDRLHRVGKFIRSTSLDELPQLLNVIKGDMSIVGPRPLLQEYLSLYTSEQMKRHEVKPGITGWAQVNGRNTISWEQKFAFDLWYVKHQSFCLDMKILILTVLKVFQAEGITSPNSATMEKFRGEREI